MGMQLGKQTWRKASYHLHMGALKSRMPVQLIYVNDFFSLQQRHVQIIVKHLKFM